MTGLQLKELRILRNYTQVKAADKLGVSLTTIERWEREDYRINKKYHPRIKSVFCLPVEKRDRSERLRKRKAQIEVLGEIGNVKFADLKEDDPRLKKLREVYDA